MAEYRYLVTYLMYMQVPDAINGVQGRGRRVEETVFMLNHGCNMNSTTDAQVRNINDEIIDFSVSINLKVYYQYSGNINASNSIIIIIIVVVSVIGRLVLRR